MKKRAVSILLAITFLMNIFAVCSFAEEEKELYNISITGTADYLKAYEAFDLVNEYRTKTGFATFTTDKDLMDAAMQRAAETAVLHSSARPNDMLNKDSFQTAYPESLQNGCYEFETAMYTTAKAFINGVASKSFMTSGYKTLAIGCVYHNGRYFWVVAGAVAEGTPETERTLTQDTTVFNITAEKNIFLNPKTEPAQLNLQPNQKDSVLFEFVNMGWIEVNFIVNPENIEVSDKAVINAEADGNAVRVEALKNGTSEIKIILESSNGAEAIESKINVVVKNSSPDVMIGDMTGDGKISVVDAKWMLQILAGSRHITVEQNIAADVNGDGKLSIVDAKWTLQIVAKLRDPDTLELINK